MHQGVLVAQVPLNVRNALTSSSTLAELKKRYHDQRLYASVCHKRRGNDRQEVKFRTLRAYLHK